MIIWERRALLRLIILNVTYVKIIVHLGDFRFELAFFYPGVINRTEVRLD